MNDSRNKELEIGGISFGLASGVIAAMGMIVGIDAATNSKLAIIASIFALAVADSLSDGVGMHLAEEIRLDEQKKSIWIISLYSFLAKFTFTLLLAVPFLLFTNSVATDVSIFFGLLLVLILSIAVAKRSKRPMLVSIFGHVSLAVIVIVASYYVGKIAERLV